MSKRKIIPYNPELKDLARELRKNMTLSEVLLWNELKNKNMGYDFDRQRPIGNYIVDFSCKDLSLVIEIEGDTHIYRYDYDDERQQSLEAIGLNFLRFDDLEVKKNMNNVLRVIGDWIERNVKEKPTPNPTYWESNQKKKPTPNPPLRRSRLSEEGNKRNKTNEKLKDKTIGLVKNSNDQKPTPNPSWEGNKNLEGDIRRYVSMPVSIGNVPLGGTNPIRIQSMTNTDTLDTKASVAQCIRIIEAGADYVRLTAQGIREAENLALIKKELRKAGFNTPLIADIHFNPLAAETAARLVEKVRINPGNYADKRASFAESGLSEKEYYEELERIHKRLLPLIRICHEHNTAIRVGINHGSLSDRIMTRYGNTPLGMVISAHEFINIFRAEGFHDLILSMKSSDTAIMIEATRQLVDLMMHENVTYPLHLGVTEAGEGEDGRIRSAAGIGTLLSEGIGDTIRVSLSEEPEKEIPVARKIADFYPRGSAFANSGRKLFLNTFEVMPEIFRKVHGPLVIANMESTDLPARELYQAAGFLIDNLSGNIMKTDGSADIIIAAEIPEVINEYVTIGIPLKRWTGNSQKKCYPVFTPDEYSQSSVKSEKLNLIKTDSGFNVADLKNIDPDTSLMIFTFYPETEKYAVDKFFDTINSSNLRFSIILNPVFDEENLETLQIKAALMLGRYLNDKNIAGISVTNKKAMDLRDINRLCFSILQSTGTRITRTIYLSCPTCGRTKFNLQEAVKKVKSATGHLKGLKIAVMGCIVNGPGEMAGADYGYVGAAPGKVHIYRGTTPVLKNIPEEEATKELLKLIEKDSRV